MLGPLHPLPISFEVGCTNNLNMISELSYPLQLPIIQLLHSICSITIWSGISQRISQTSQSVLVSLKSYLSKISSRNHLVSLKSYLSNISSHCHSVSLKFGMVSLFIRFHYIPNSSFYYLEFEGKC
jgi:hypothetical protein